MAHDTTEPTVNINKLCDLYLSILDGRQSNVYNIRMMHHEVWKRTRPQKIIKHHRAGSRVERQLRLLPVGVKSDVDYKYEVGGILVDIKRSDPESLYYKSSNLPVSGSEAHGVVYATKATKERLLSDDNYKKIFEDSFEFDKTENAFMLIPNRFKENVVNECGMDMRKDSLKRRIQSPAISGQGAMNEYDAVPCLRLSSWPLVAENWTQRKPINKQVFSTEWKSRIFREESLFIVPTGNPQSEMEKFEWRLSYSFIEKECFEQIHSVACHRMRHLYAILKYVFKKVYEEKDVLNSYHLKTLFFWKVENWPMEKWKSISVTDFITECHNEIKQCMQIKCLDHYFIDGCNIFPYHKLTNENKFSFDTVNMINDIEDILIQTILTDLHLPRNGTFLQQAFSQLRAMDSKSNSFGSYVSAYLTRLLSVCVHSIYDNIKTRNLHNCLEELKFTFTEYQHDSNIQRIVPILNSVLVRFDPDISMILSGSSPCSLDLASIVAIETLGEYIDSKNVSIDKVDLYLEQCNAVENIGEMIGVTVVKMEAEKMEDDPIHYIFRYLSEIDNQSKRIFFEPVVILLHLKIKHYIQVSFEDLQKQKIMSMSDIVSHEQKQNQNLPAKGVTEYKLQSLHNEKKHKEKTREIDMREQAIQTLHQKDTKEQETKQTMKMRMTGTETCDLHQENRQEEITQYQKDVVREEETHIVHKKTTGGQSTKRRKTTQGQTKHTLYQNNKDELFNMLRQMTKHVVQSSDRLPYVGILSYKYTGLLLLRGFKHYLREKFDFEFPDVLDVTPESLEQLPKYSTNLDIT